MTRRSGGTGFRMYRAALLRLSPRRDALKRIPGVTAIHRRLYPRLRPHEPVAVSVHGFDMLVDPRDLAIGEALIRDGTWEPYETDLFTAAIKPGAVVADIGANIGYYTLLAARAVGPTGTVLAFEPDPDNFALLSANVRTNRFDNVVLVPAALGDQAGTLDLHRDARNFGNHSLAGENVPDEGDVVKVEVRTLDDSLAGHGRLAVDVLKLDVQGAEGLVLQGGREALRARPICFTEFWPDGLRRFGTDPDWLLQLFLDGGYHLDLIDHERSHLVRVDVDGVRARAETGDRYCDLLLTPSQQGLP